MHAGKAACWRINRAMGAIRRLEHRRRALRHRAACRRRSILPAPITENGSLRLENMLIERGLVGADEIAAGHALRPGKAAASAALHRRRRRARPDARLVRPAAHRPRLASSPGDAGRARKYPPGNAYAPAAIRRAAMSAWSKRLHGCHVFPDQRRRPARRRSAMALHRTFRRPRAVGRGRRPDCHGLDRCVRALSGARSLSMSGEVTSTIRRASRRRWPVTAHVPRDDRRPGVSRAMGGAGLRHGAGAARTRRVSPGRNGQRCSGEEIKKAQAAGDPDTGETYYRHWLATLERMVAEKGVTTARQSCATMPARGTTRPIGRLTECRSICVPRISGRGEAKRSHARRCPERGSTRSLEEGAGTDRYRITLWAASSATWLATC